MATQLAREEGLLWAFRRLRPWPPVRGIARRGSSGRPRRGSGHRTARCGRFFPLQTPLERDLIPCGRLRGIC